MTDELTCICRVDSSLDYAAGDPRCPVHSVWNETPEDYTLYCDAPECGLSVTIPLGVAREEHGWGRITDYTPDGPKDYDLCQWHYDAAQGALRSQKEYEDPDPPARSLP